MKEKINIVKKYGITTVGFFIIGFPFDTEKDIEDTRKAESKLGLALGECPPGNFVPLPGTESYQYLVKFGEISEDYLPAYVSGKVEYSPKSISRDTLSKLHSRIILR